MVKFGGYDEAGFVSGNMKLLSTITDKSWEVNANAVSFMVESFVVSRINQITIVEPAYPFFYFPPDIVN